MSDKSAKNYLQYISLPYISIGTVGFIAGCLTETDYNYRFTLIPKTNVVERVSLSGSNVNTRTLDAKVSDKNQK